MISEILNKIINKRKPQISTENKEFIEQNREMWSSYSVKKSNQKILIEEYSIPVITHANAIFTVILNQAKSFTPVWLCNSNCDIELFKSYVPTAEFAKIPLSPIDKLNLFFVAIKEFLIIYKTKDILSFSYDGVKYGDIVYDVYLATFHVATIKKIDLKLIFIIYFCICTHEGTQKTLRKDSFEAVLVSHPIGKSGIMLRTALRYGYKGYLRVGDHELVLQCFEKLDEVYNHPMISTPKEIETIISELGSKFDVVYNEVFNERVTGKYSIAATTAFSNTNKQYFDRESFNCDLGLDSKRKNVFVMLHAFTDHPHSHFKRMIFKDYYDWFAETLKFAEKHDAVNWIFKQHPAIKYYPTKDVSYETLFSGTPDNIIYISENNQIDTRSLIHCADLIITCLGSAGFELPAMAGIPSVTAGDNLYMDLGFAIEPKTKSEYFEILANANNIERLTSEQQQKARAAFLYIHKLSRVNVTACPAISLDDMRDNRMEKWYFEKVCALYQTERKVIKDELNNYVTEIAKSDFKRLNSLSSRKMGLYDFFQQHFANE